VSCAQCSPCLSFLMGFVSSFCVLCPMLPVSLFFGGVRVFFLCLMSNVNRVYLFWWSVCLPSVYCAQCYPLPSFFGAVRVFFLCLVSNDIGVYLSVSCIQCYPCLSFLVGFVSSFCVLCPMFSVYIFLMGSVSSSCVLCPMFSVSIFFGGVRVFFLCLVSNVSRVYRFWRDSCLLSVSCVQCSPCLSFLVGFVFSFCVLCPMLPVTIFFGGVRVFFLCLVPNVLRVYLFWWGPCLLSVSCAQCYPCLSFLVGSVPSFCVLCPLLPVFIFSGGVRLFFLCLVSNVTRVYLFWWSVCLLSVSCV
jgi:hypothetical protein